MLHLKNQLLSQLPALQLEARESSLKPLLVALSLKRIIILGECF
jgi:hypothetical protein